MEAHINRHLDVIETLIRERMPGSLYQFELLDLASGKSYGRGDATYPMLWGSVYKLFVIAAIVQMIDEGILQPEQLLHLDKVRFKYGEGIVKQFKHLTHLSVEDCCRMVIATSDNVCIDTLHELVGNERMARLFAAADCTHSRLTDNLNTLIGRLMAAPHQWATPDYMYSPAMFANYETAIADVLPDNCTTATDCNRLWHYLHTAAFSADAHALFFDIARTHNLHSRTSRYANYCASPKLSGKTGSIGPGVVMNETNLVYDPVTKESLGFFSFFSRHNRLSFYELYDVLAFAGLELAKVYAPSN